MFAVACSSGPIKTCELWVKNPKLVMAPRKCSDKEKVEPKRVRGKTKVLSPKAGKQCKESFFGPGQKAAKAKAKTSASSAARQAKQEGKGVGLGAGTLRFKFKI